MEPVPHGATRAMACTLAALALLSTSCAVFSTGQETYLRLLPAVPKDAGPLTGEATACLIAASDQAERSRANRQVDMGLIAVAALFGANGLGMTTASTFISPTSADGRTNDLRQWVAGTGAISVGIGGALLALRTALNLGELSSSQNEAAASQASLAMEMITEKDAVKRDSLYSRCAQLSSKPNSAYPSAPSKPPGTESPVATTPPALNR